MAQAFAWQQGDDSKHGADGRGRSWIVRAGDYTGALSRTRLDAVAFHVTQDPISGDIAPSMSKGNRTGTDTIGVAYALRRDPGGTGQGHNTNYVPGESGVRRLTPRECERLQGFPDDWTLIPWNGKPSPDSRRYAALGDAVTVNVAEWIGRRILKTEKGA